MAKLIGINRQLPPELLAFYSAFKDIPWNEWLSKAESEVDIVVHFADDWTAQNEEHLKRLFGSGARINLYMPEVASQKVCTHLMTLYPFIKSETALTERVQRTKSLFTQAMTSVGAKDSSLQIFNLKWCPTYALLRIDQRIALLSHFDYADRPGQTAPAVVIDLSMSKRFAQYLDNELAALAKHKV